MPFPPSQGAMMSHVIRQYKLEQGALEVQYIEEGFPEFSNRKKSADEIIRRLRDREHLILLSMAPSPDDEASFIPVAFKVGHQLRSAEADPKLARLVQQLSESVDFTRGKVFYSWIGATREGWRCQGHYRALTEQQEEWAHRHGYHCLVVKTKNKFYPMRAVLDHLRFDVIKLEPNPADLGESKVFLAKRLGPDQIERHRTVRTVEDAV